MRSYTSKGRDKAAQDLDLGFELDGVEWKCETSISVLDLSEFARLAVQGVESGSPEGLAILADIFQGLLGTSYQRFRAHCRKHGADDETLVDILKDLFEQAAERPTSRPSDSSDGPPSDPDTQKVVSFKRGTVEDKPIEEMSAVLSYG